MIRYLPASAGAASYGAPGSTRFGNPTTGGSHHYIGEPHAGAQISLLDDKIAAPEHMRYTDGREEECFKTTMNYLMSKAHKMKEFLPWAESFQSHVVTPQHVRALADVGICSDIETEARKRRHSQMWNWAQERGPAPSHAPGVAQFKRVAPMGQRHERPRPVGVQAEQVLPVRGEFGLI